MCLFFLRPFHYFCFCYWIHSFVRLLYWWMLHVYMSMKFVSIYWSVWVFVGKMYSQQTTLNDERKLFAIYFSSLSLSSSSSSSSSAIMMIVIIYHLICSIVLTTADQYSIQQQQQQTSKFFIQTHLIFYNYHWYWKWCQIKVL